MVVSVNLEGMFSSINPLNLIGLDPFCLCTIVVVALNVCPYASTWYDARFALSATCDIAASRKIDDFILKVLGKSNKQKN